MQIPPVGTLGALALLAVVGAAMLSMSQVTLLEYARGVRWHDLRVRCQRMRRERLMAMLEKQAEPTSSAPNASAIARIGAAGRGAGDADSAGTAEQSATPADIAGRLDGSSASRSPTARAA